MDLEHKLETICKNRMEVKSNNAMVRESLYLIGILLLILGLSLRFATLLDVFTNELSVITSWSKSPIVIVTTLVIQLVVIWRMFDIYKNNKVGKL